MLKQNKKGLKMSEEKRGLPLSWRKFNDKEILENIEYLLKHYKEYRITVLPNDDILVGTTFIGPLKTKALGAPTYYINCAIVQGKGELGDCIKKLIDVCKKEFDMRKEAMTRTEQRIENQELTKIAPQKNKPKMDWSDVVVYSAYGVFFAGIIIHLVIENHKANKVNTKIEQYEQSLPNYDEYEQTKSQIINYRDSLEKSKIK